MATRVTCWCASVGKVVDVLACVAYYVGDIGGNIGGELGSIVVGALFLKLFPKTGRK